MNKPTESEWAILSEKRIFFGHQSVGQDIVEGINDLKNGSNVNEFVILETRNKSDLQHPLFAHTFVGKNSDPKSKIDDFVAVLQSGLADSVDIVFMKLCYVDIDRHTNINKLFEYYQTSVGILQEKYPQVRIIHFTVPVTIRQKGIKGLVKLILGMDNNVPRNKYNKLLRNRYKENELFDIAKIEAISPDGTTNKYGFGIPGLVPEYTYDGRHLNAQGRQLIASELLRFLARF